MSMEAFRNKIAFERGLLERGIVIRGGSMNIDISGPVVRWWLHLEATCSRCGELPRMTFDELKQHFEEHADDDAADRILKRTS